MRNDCDKHTGKNLHEKADLNLRNSRYKFSRNITYAWATDIRSVDKDAQATPVEGVVGISIIDKMSVNLHDEMYSE